MKRVMKFALSGAALSALALAAPAMAQTDDEKTEVTVQMPEAGRPDPMAMLLPMLNLKPAPEPEPARYEIAKRVVIKVIPNGALRSMMTKIYDGLMGTFSKFRDPFPAGRIALMSGRSAEEIKELPQSTKDDIMAIVDPHWREREKIETESARKMMGDAMDALEPVMRDVFARAYARKFTAPQLGELEAFFNTPTGSMYASYMLEMVTDPNLLSDTFAKLPELKDKFPNLQAQMAEAKASVPPAPTFDELSDADKAKLAELLGVEPGDLKNGDAIELTFPDEMDSESDPESDDGETM